MSPSVGGSRRSLVLAALRAAAAASVGVVAASCGGSHHETGSARSSRGAPAPPVARVTFSPRSTLARLDLRTGRVAPLPAPGFFSFVDPSVSRSGAIAVIASRCAACRQMLTILPGRHSAQPVEATSAAWLSERELVVSVGRGDETELSLVDRNGRRHELHWLTRAAKAMAVETEKELALSPDGRTLLFSGEGGTEHHGNYIVDLRRHRLDALSGEADDAPAFSPDGRTIAYQHVVATGDWDVCVARISVARAWDDRCFHAAGNDRQPVFLRNGRQLVFSSDRAAPRSGVSSLYLLDLDTRSVRRLTPGGYDATSPAAAPDGRGVIFVRRALVRLR